MCCNVYYALGPIVASFLSNFEDGAASVMYNRLAARQGTSSSPCSVHCTRCLEEQTTRP